MLRQQRMLVGVSEVNKVVYRDTLHVHRQKVMSLINSWQEASCNTNVWAYGSKVFAAYNDDSKRQGLDWPEVKAKDGLDLPESLRQLEDNKKRLGILDVQIQMTSLEEVFLNIAKQAEIDAEKEQERREK